MKHWKIWLSFAVAALVWILFSRKRDTIQTLWAKAQEASQDEKEALQARKALRHKQHEEVVEEIQARHDALRQQLDQETLSKMETLRNDPPELARRYNQLARHFGAKR